MTALLPDAAGDFIDVGANIGQTLCDYVYSGHQRRYWGIEPNPKCWPVLDHLIRRNGLVNCSVLKFGLSEREQTCPLYTEPGVPTDTRATMHAGLRPGRPYQAIEVRLLPFDLVRDLYDITEIGLIKIDAEGAELEILRGMTSTLTADRPIVLCEVLLRDSKADAQDYDRWANELMQFLREIDYDVYPLRARALTSFKTAPLAEFPRVTWTLFRAHQCEYIFKPREVTVNLAVTRPRPRPAPPGVLP